MDQAVKTQPPEEIRDGEAGKFRGRGVFSGMNDYLIALLLFIFIFSWSHNLIP